MPQPHTRDPYAGWRELTLRGMILGALITVVFTASNVYLGLKVGLTFATSIPAAVISMAVLKFFKGSNILENNMVQTQASAAGTLSTIIFVLPGLLMAGYWNGFPFWQTTLLCVSGGILGVIFTVPLRYAMVVKSSLPYPEGVAAAEILKVGSGEHEDAEQGQSGDSGVREILSGGLLAGLMSFLAGGLRVISDSASYWFKAGNAIFQLPMGFSLALLGAGYLVGLTGGIAILVGIFIAWGGAVPYFSNIIPQPSDMDMTAFAMQLWKEKVRFIGAGTIGIAAVWTLIMLAKPMAEGMRLSFGTFSGSGSASAERTEQDLSPKSMILIVLGMMLLPLYRGGTNVRGHRLDAGGRVHATDFGYRLPGGGGLRLYGGFGRFVRQPDFGHRHRIDCGDFPGAAGGRRIVGTVCRRGQPSVYAGADAVLRFGGHLRGFDFQRQPARLENRLSG